MELRNEGQTPSPHTQGGVNCSDAGQTDEPLRTVVCQRSIPVLKAASVIDTHIHPNTHTLTANTTFVTSHTLVISKDTKPTRFPTQFSRTQPKCSCKQALSLTGRREKNILIERKGMEGEKEVDFYLAQTFISALQHT